MITEECNNCKGIGKFRKDKKYVPCNKCDGTGIISSYQLSEDEIKEEALEKKRVKMISLWSEGYAATSQSSDATFHGTFKAINLQDAVSQFKESLKDESSKELINIKRLTFWGCKFFTNELEARKSFG